MRDYPLPPFIMLEIRKVDFNKNIQVLLVDKKHNEVLDCKNSQFNIETGIQCFIEEFKQSLYDNGVI